LLIVIGPTIWLADFGASTLLGTTQDVVVEQLGPVTTICTVATLKLLPLTVTGNVPDAATVGEI
jgi:hypothetical protein